MQFLATIIPAIVLVYIFYTFDKFPEPKKYIIITFILGIVIAFPAGYLNVFADNYLNESIDNNSPYLFLKILIPGPVIEELLKYFILVFYCLRLSAFDEPMDGLVYGSTAALGFAMIENFQYVYNASDFNSSWQDVAWVRAFLTIPMHGSTGVILGFFLSYYYFYKKQIFFYIGPLVAILIHFLYNFGYFKIMVIISLIIIFFMFRHLRKKQNSITK